MGFGERWARPRQVRSGWPAVAAVATISRAIPRQSGRRPPLAQCTRTQLVLSAFPTSVGASVLGWGG
jgi:hypothetical protein